MTYRIVDAEPWHLPAVSDAMNEDDVTELRALGLEPRLLMEVLFHGSCYRKCAVIEGRPVALWGMTGTLMSCDGEVWLALTDAARAFPMSVARVAARELSDLMEGRMELRSSILCRNERALRFARVLGFRIVETCMTPIPHFQAILRAWQ